jgi:hypothetical protein
MNRAKVVNHFLMVPWELLKRKAQRLFQSPSREADGDDCFYNSSTPPPGEGDGVIKL